MVKKFNHINNTITECLPNNNRCLTALELGNKIFKNELNCKQKDLDNSKINN